MDQNFYIREISPESAGEVICSVGFDKAYAGRAVKKYGFKLIKICGLSCPQATIIKQVALSCGADAAVHREVITCRVEKTDVLIGATVAQLETICDKLKHQPFSLAKLAQQLTRRFEQVKHRWSDKKYIMGILNVTPDSFSDGGRYFDPEKAAQHALEMAAAGADIIDIGGESTRPFSKEVDADEELKRVLPVVEKIRAQDDKIFLSIDTRHSKTALAAVAAGVNMINDVSGLEWEADMTSVAARLEVPVVIMHSLASPETMQVSPSYEENVVDAVYKSLFDRTTRAIDSGIKPENIIIDPGIGFGKTLSHNFELIKRIGEFRSMGYPVLVGISRKSFVSKTIDASTEETEAANIALNTYAVTNGADIIRVHSVAEHFKAMEVLRNLYQTS